ncbi:heat-inducible transcriptional repressor HrcA [Bacillus chungangensis]|uniref:Heat-inducible transcription repressor HrcA n=1 Tax=Bacillus chungangensis TaxID=587633 RepID=A0ABT9WMK4_9BACI|nr:heat-inducible transcriptional repressor HrcA [Bacillus chungangensis]MDQ0174197.1 heat-inducible transcriptional repressor [Bacillus chungangensis]
MLTDRQLLILQIIIDEFIENAHPVGSGTISKIGNISFSTATIRNEMANLENMGYIEKTHTSSGRIPSEKGYRYYVDHLISPQKLDAYEKSKIHSIFSERMYELEKVVQKSASILSEMTNYTAILLGPAVKDNKLKKIQLVPLNEETAVAILITDTGHVENQMFTLHPAISSRDLEKVVNILNDQLVGVPIMDLKRKMKNEVLDVLRHHILHDDFVLQTIMSAFELSSHEKVFFGGKTNMLNQPEFHDLQKIRLLLDMIEQEQGVYELFRDSPHGIHVKIGTENQHNVMNHCSLITATYEISNEPVGTIAILGPTRMEYSRVISLLDFLSDDLSKALTRLYHG